MCTIKTDFMDGFLFHTFDARPGFTIHFPSISPPMYIRYTYMNNEQSINFVAEKPDVVTDELRN